MRAGVSVGVGWSQECIHIGRPRLVVDGCLVKGLGYAEIQWPCLDFGGKLTLNVGCLVMESPPTVGQGGYGSWAIARPAGAQLNSSPSYSPSPCAERAPRHAVNFSPSSSRSP
eukprot:1289978-Alexandrium_andersonii.AAC.1